MAPRGLADTPESAPSAEGGFVAWIPKGRWESGHSCHQECGALGHGPQSGRGPWLSLAHFRLLRGWPGARVPEGRRESLLRKHFSAKREREEREETEKHTTKLGCWQASWPGMCRCGRWVEEVVRGTRASGLLVGGPQLPLRSESLGGAAASGGQGRDLVSGHLEPPSFHCLRVVLGERPSHLSLRTPVHSVCASEAFVASPQRLQPRARMESGKPPLCNGERSRSGHPQ